MKITKRNHAILILLVLTIFPFCEREDLLKFLKKAPISLSITPSPAVRRINGTIQFRALAMFSSSTTEDVTDKTVWSVSGSATPESAPGSFKAAPSEGTATIIASFTTLSGTILTASVNLEVTDDIFVAVTGSDSGAGTPEDPFQTIEHALSVAGAGMNIRIAKGDYYPASQIQLTVDGVSLIGGYAADWSHDFVNNKARIYDGSTTGTSPKGAIYCGSTITSTTHIEGLEIYGSTVFTGAMAVAVNTAGNPTVRHCRLIGGKGTDSSCGLYSTTTGNLDLGYSDINGGTGPNTSYGILEDTGSMGTLTIYNSTINGGTGATTSYGIRCSAANNTLIITYTEINGGTSSNSSTAVYTVDTGNSIIGYSNIDGGSASYSNGIIQASTGSSALIVKNSTISGGTGANRNTGISSGNATAAPSPYIYNNIIICGSNPSGTIDATGIQVSFGSRPIIANNTISIGISSNIAQGVYTAYSARPYIYNNLFMFNSGTRYGIYEGYTGGDPLAVSNNLFYNTNILYRNCIDVSVYDDWITIATMETGLNADGTTASGNIDIDPLIVGSGDFHLTASSPAISTGLNGMDLGWANFPLDSTSSYPIDREGNPRPIAGGGNWSIGAYEYIP